MAEPDIVAAPVKYGVFSTRMLASTIDICIIFMVALPLVDMVIAQFIPGVNVDSFVGVVNTLSVKYYALPVPARIVSVFRDPEFMAMVRQQHLIERTIAENVMQAACIALYIIPFWCRHSATPGKMLFRLQIRDAKTGAVMTDRQSVIRFLGYFVSGLPFSLGFVWISFNKKRRGFHDYIAGTVVVSRPLAPVNSVRQSEGP